MKGIGEGVTKTLRVAGLHILDLVEGVLAERLIGKTRGAPGARGDPLGDAEMVLDGVNGLEQYAAAGLRLGREIRRETQKIPERCHGWSQPSCRGLTLQSTRQPSIADDRVPNPWHDQG